MRSFCFWNLLSNSNTHHSTGLLCLRRRARSRASPARCRGGSSSGGPPFHNTWGPSFAALHTNHEYYCHKSLQIAMLKANLLHIHWENTKTNATELRHQPQKFYRLLELDLEQTLDPANGENKSDDRLCECGRHRKTSVYIILHGFSTVYLTWARIIPVWTRDRTTGKPPTPV